MTILFGADPEFFAVYVKKGKPYCLPPVFFRKNGVPFQENNRHPIFMHASEGQMIHEDGAAFEMAVPPSNSWEVLWNRIHTGIEEFNSKFLVNYPVFEVEGLQAFPTVGWEVARWANEGDDFHLSTIFGCDPDIDLFNTERKCRVINASKHKKRYGGGHIHVSGIPGLEENPLPALRMMVITAGLAAVGFSHVPDMDRERTYLYGKPGKYRLQTYSDGTIGIEYRTPSNAWTANKELARRIFEAVQFGIEKLLPTGRVNTLMQEIQEEVADTIIRCDQDKAKSLLGYVLAQ
jgi:hypothetical protein